MHNKLKLTFLLVIFMSFQSHGQINQLSLMGIDTDEFTQAYNPETDDKSLELEKPKKEINEETQREKFKDSNYGYSGGENFNNPPQNKFSEEALEYFGYSYFLNGPDALFSQANAPISPNYLIGPDDTVNVILYGNKNKTYELKVSRDGNIFFPEIGPLSVAGLSFGDMQNLIKTTIASQLIGTQVSLTLGSLRTIDVFILGAANKPGMYSISALSNITNAIFESGGVDTSGSLRDIKLKRNGRTIVNFDLYDLFLNGDTSNDSRLMQGDVIFIESIGKTAGVKGEVNRPAIYELKDGENLDHLVRFAGGMKPKANYNNAEIIRINSAKNNFELQSVDLSLAKEDIRIINGDVLTIYPVPDNLSNSVLVNGHAQQPGFYPWSKGMKISDIFTGPEDLLEMTDLNYALVKRKISNSQTYEFLQIDLEKIFKDTQSEENIDLSDQDVIILLPSLLTPDLITTKIIQDKYTLDQETNQILIQDEWTSLSYLNKSLRANDQNSQNKNPSFADSDTINDVNIANTNEKFYEYSIYEYCIIPTDFALRILKSKGLTKIDSIPTKDLYNVKTPLQLESLLSSLEIEEENEILESPDEINIQLTNICRRQLIDPIISIVKSQANPSVRTKIIKSFGNLLYPGTYPYSKNMDLEKVIYASGGLKDGDYLPQIEINSREIRNKEYIISSRNLVFSNNQNIKELIEPMDEINVKEVSNKFRTVEILGEVSYPGLYPIIEGESLNDLIRRAGGIKESASYKGAIFTRESLRKSDRKRLKEAQTDLRRKILLSMSQMQVAQQGGNNNSAGISEMVKLLTFEQKDNEFLGRLVIDLESMLTGKSPEIYLEDKDKIFIPRKHQMVTVVGEVNGSNSHQYKQNLGVSDYISLSGSFSSFGDEDNVYIIKSDGSTYSYSKVTDGFFRGSSQIQPGDTIVVPFKAEKFGELRAASEITQIIYQMAIAAAAVNSF